MILAEKNMPSLLGKKRKKDERPKSGKNSAAPAVKPAVPGTAPPAGSSVPPIPDRGDIAAAAPALSGAPVGDGADALLPDSSSKKARSRSVHFAQSAAGGCHEEGGGGGGGGAAGEGQGKGKGKEGGEGGSFRLFDSVMFGANGGQQR
jgi:hypothetical protein